MEKIIDFITDNFPWFAIGFIVLIGLVACYEEAYYPCKEYKDVVAYTMPSYIYQNGFSVPV